MLLGTSSPHPAMADDLLRRSLGAERFQNLHKNVLTMVRLGENCHVSVGLDLTSNSKEKASNTKELRHGSSIVEWSSYRRERQDG